MNDNEVAVNTMLAFDPAWIKVTTGMGRLQGMLVTDGRRVTVAWHCPDALVWYVRSMKDDKNPRLQDFNVTHYKHGLRDFPGAPTHHLTTQWHYKKNRKLARSAMAELAPGLIPYFPNDKPRA